LEKKVALGKEVLGEVFSRERKKGDCPVWRKVLAVTSELSLRYLDTETSGKASP